VVQLVADVAKGTWAEFGEIILGEPAIVDVNVSALNAWNFVRVHFKIWPGQGNLIETTFRLQVVKAMKVLDADYTESQVPVIYRASTTPRPVFPRRESRPDGPPQ
jgi:hypothetical protein